MQYCSLGSTCFTVSRLCFGSLTLGYLGANLPLLQGAALLREALELGVNFIDTAQYYANYNYIRRALQGWSCDVVIAAKTYARDEAGIIAAIEEARHELDREQIEIFLLHEEAGGGALQADLPALECLHRVKARGLIGAVGISTHSAEAARLAARLPEVEVIHPLINQRGIGIIGGGLADMIEALELAKAQGKAIYGMKAIGGGSLISEAEKHLIWAFSRPYLDAVAVGMRQKSELITNIAWLMGQDSSEGNRIANIPRQLRLEPGNVCTACGCCTGRCSQQALIIAEGRLQWKKEKCLLCGYCIPACPHFYLSIV
jgi:aryl-alcohol dehydrogenase-like predicted oxidoreductase